MLAEPRFIPLTLCYHRKEDVFEVRFISNDPEAIRLIPALSAPPGVLTQHWTAEELAEHFGIDEQLVQVARSNPGQWYEVANGTFHEADPFEVDPAEEVLQR